MAKNTQLETITKIDIGAQSQLMPVAGSWVQLYFEVTNLRDVPTFHTYLLVDEQRFLRSLDPRSYVQIKANKLQQCLIFLCIYIFSVNCCAFD